MNKKSREQIENMFDSILDRHVRWQEGLDSSNVWRKWSNNFIDWIINNQQEDDCNNQWTNVEDDLPKDGHDVLGQIENWYFDTVVFYSKGNSNWYTRKLNDDNYSFSWMKVKVIRWQQISLTLQEDQS